MFWLKSDPNSQKIPSSTCLAPRSLGLHISCPSTWEAFWGRNTCHDIPKPNPLGLDPQPLSNWIISIHFPHKSHLGTYVEAIAITDLCNDAKGETHDWLNGWLETLTMFSILNTINSSRAPIPFLSSVQVDLQSCEKSFGPNLRKSVSQKMVSTWAIYGQVAKSRLWKDRPEPFAPQTMTLSHSAFGHTLSLYTKTKAMSEPCFLRFVATCSHIHKDTSIKHCQHCFARQGSAGLRWRCTRYGVSPPWAKSHKGHEIAKPIPSILLPTLYGLYRIISLVLT